MAIKEPDLLHKLLDHFAKSIGEYLKYQIKSGAQVVQIFDSWAGLLQQEHLSEYCYSPTADIVDHIKSKKVPVICFQRGIKKSYLDFFRERFT